MQAASQGEAAAAQQVNPTRKDAAGPDSEQILLGSLFDNLIQKSKKTESRVQGVCLTHSALL